MMRRLGLAIVLLLVLGGAALLLLAPQLAQSRLRAMASARGLEASWQRFTFRFPAGAEVDGLLVRHAGVDDTLLIADRLDVALRPLDLLTGHARPARLLLSHAHIHL